MCQMALIISLRLPFLFNIFLIKKLIFACRKKLYFRQILSFREIYEKKVIKNALSLSWKDMEVGDIKNNFVSNFCTLLNFWMLKSYL